ncbi:ornithine cyclodeaminase/mu-crystallin (plasmid) [Gemmatirosa kalamazoonensis]|uniref:Ornithine cyclodeaminase/mu-crystallin n=1 Tax=Gemmatirosa kalamazoonensis TaxID=861299 RepID=W0RNB1_9BACT|nr:ornithine cyclodeaminase family protein [Gemmatirosa kalamazoonensis]AHG92226.1 ornithine cyclodeaminase/mu-crystallin [Gemmatirosa kalamazoonensis]
MNGFPEVRILSAEESERAVDASALLDEIARGFVDYSAGRVAVPPVGHLGFDDPPGDLHVKYGHVRGDDVFVIKVATGFPGNVARGLPTGDGAMLVLDARTGLLRAILLDHARLTDLRTAAAGAVAARALARRDASVIGLLGAGVQALLQLRLLAHVTPARAVLVWNRTRERAESLVAEAALLGFNASVAPDAATVAATADLLVTTTAARAPLFPADAVRPGTHVTAVGADAPGKQELDPALFGRADLVVVDSRAQCADHGELSHALAAGVVRADTVRELGEVLADRVQRAEESITVCDLTGVAVQDIVIARHVLARA